MFGESASGKDSVPQNVKPESSALIKAKCFSVVWAVNVGTDLFFETLNCNLGSSPFCSITDRVSDRRVWTDENQHTLFYFLDTQPQVYVAGSSLWYFTSPCSG